MNAFRCKDGSLDQKYLRLCAVYKLLQQRVIGRGRALDLLAERHTADEMKRLRGAVELWFAWPLREDRS